MGLKWFEHEDQDIVETLTLGHGTAKALFKVFSGKAGEFYVSIIPSLNVSGYGMTEEEASKDLQENLDTFFYDIFKVSEDQRRLYLRELGWTIDRFFKKKFSKAYVDENGVLQNFDNPSQVKRNVFQAA